MFIRLLLLFILLPMIELYFLIVAGGYFGAFHTILMVIGTGVLGAYIAKAEGNAVLYRIVSELNSGRFPASEMIDGLFVFAGGILLLTPGFLTDMTGFLFLFPASRIFFKRLLERYIKERLARDGHFSINIIDSRPL